MNPQRDNVVAWSLLDKLIKFPFKRENKVRRFYTFWKWETEALFFIPLHDIILIGFLKLLKFDTHRWFLGTSRWKKLKKDPLKCVLVFFTSIFQLWVIFCEQLMRPILNFCYLRLNFLTFSMAYLNLLPYTFSIYDPEY